MNFTLKVNSKQWPKSSKDYLILEIYSSSTIQAADLITKLSKHLMNQRELKSKNMKSSFISLQIFLMKKLKRFETAEVCWNHKFQNIWKQTPLWFNKKENSVRSMTMKILICKPRNLVSLVEILKIWQRKSYKNLKLWSQVPKDKVKVFRKKQRSNRRTRKTVTMNSIMDL